MNRRGFIKALAAGALTLAATTRLAGEAWKVGFQRLRDGDDISGPLQAALDSAMPGEEVVVPSGSYVMSKGVVVQEGRRLAMSNSFIESTEGFSSPYMFHIVGDGAARWDGIYLEDKRGLRSCSLLEKAPGWKTLTT